MALSKLSEEEARDRLNTLIGERKQREKWNRIEYLDPYLFQRRVLASSLEHNQTLLMAANRVGKSFIGAANVSYQATGKYPDWWEGHRWENGPVTIWAAGVSAESTRDILQKELLGPVGDIELQGSGAIPADCVGVTTRKAQVPNGIATVKVKHHDRDGNFDGWSTIHFKAYEQGEKKFMGSSVHLIWLDEQPPDGLFGQCITRTADTGGHVLMTFTPEDGMTPIVHKFMHDIKPGMELIQATWDDAPHLTQEVRAQLLEVYGEHERDMRSKGIPIFGSGPVFTTLEEDIKIEPFEVPEYWTGLSAIDFGWDHPTAVVWCRYDPDSDTVYIVDVYRKREAVIAMHAAAIKTRMSVPVIWPHDGYKHETGSGVSTSDQYRQQGIKMHYTHFLNPLAVGEKGQGNYKIEPGINAVSERLMTGRLKVFKTCWEWFEEYRLYHREDGKIYDKNDDLMSATRYLVQSLRFAEVPDMNAFGSSMGRSKISYIRPRLA